MIEYETIDSDCKYCRNCRYAKIIGAQDGWPFVGCFRSPLHGKWICEIKFCELRKLNALKEVEE